MINDGPKVFLFRKMDQGDKNLVEMLAKVIEEGKNKEKKYCGYMCIFFLSLSSAKSNVYFVPQFEPFNYKKSKTTSSFISLFHFMRSASDTDDNHEVLMAGRRYLSIQEFASAIPNHLLLGSLLEHLCFVYESNPARSRMLFKGMYWDEVTAGLKNNTYIHLYIVLLYLWQSLASV